MVLAFVLLATVASAQVPPAFNYASGASGGGVTGLTTCAAGTALADNLVLRADGTTACQGSTATLADSGSLTVTGPVLLPGGAVGAPALAFSGAADRGIYAANGALQFGVNGVSSVAVTDSSAMLRAGHVLGWTSGAPDSTSLVAGFDSNGTGRIRVNAGSAGATGWLQWAGECYVAADQTNATTTPASSTCSITVTSGRKYSGLCVFFVADSVAGEGVAIDFDGGAVAATNFRRQCVAHDSALAGSQSATALATDFSAATFTGDGQIECNVSFEPSSSGTFIPRFMQASHATGTMTLYRGSHCYLFDNP